MIFQKLFFNLDESLSYFLTLINLLNYTRIDHISKLIEAPSFSIIRYKMRLLYINIFFTYWIWQKI